MERGEKLEQLKLLMYQRHVSQAKLAKAIGISERAFSQKMQGKVDFWWREVAAICKFLEIGNPCEYFPT